MWRKANWTRRREAKERKKEKGKVSLSLSLGLIRLKRIYLFLSHLFLLPPTTLKAKLVKTKKRMMVVPVASFSTDTNTICSISIFFWFLLFLPISSHLLYFFFGPPSYWRLRLIGASLFLFHSSCVFVIIALSSDIAHSFNSPTHFPPFSHSSFSSRKQNSWAPFKLNIPPMYFS